MSEGYMRGGDGKRYPLGHCPDCNKPIVFDGRHRCEPGVVYVHGEPRTRASTPARVHLIDLGLPEVQVRFTSVAEFDAWAKRPGNEGVAPTTMDGLIRAFRDQGADVVVVTNPDLVEPDSNPWAGKTADEMPPYQGRGAMPNDVTPDGTGAVGTHIIGECPRCLHRGPPETFLPDGPPGVNTVRCPNPNCGALMFRRG